VGITKTSGSFREDINASAKERVVYYELKQHKQWFDKECSKLLDQRKHAKLQWLQNPSQMHGDNVNSVRCVISRTSKNKREYLQDKDNEQTIRT
jgi:hypothetical protein